MTNFERAKCFFPGTRKEIIVQDIRILKNAAGEARIKLDLAMPFDDGKLVGMPDWIGQAYDHIGKEDTVERNTKFDVELESMSLYCHTTEDITQPAQTLFNVLLKTFQMTREKQDDDEEELSDVNLQFAAYVPANQRLWTWLYPYKSMKLFVRFETTQAELPVDQAQEDSQMKLGDVDDAARKDATSKKRDAEFARA